MRWKATLFLVPLLALAAPALAKEAPLPLPPPVPMPPPQNCVLPEHRQFDFWVGDWEVRQTGKIEEMAGVSLVESINHGCGIREAWSPFSMIRGASLTSYDPRDRMWHQSYIDAANSRVEFQGGLKDGRMVLTGVWRGLYRDGRDGLMRLSWERTKDGWVRQVGEISVDEGKAWTPSFDFTYVPRQP